MNLIYALLVLFFLLILRFIDVMAYPCQAPWANQFQQIIILAFSGKSFWINPTRLFISARRFRQIIKLNTIRRIRLLIFNGNHFRHYLLSANYFLYFFGKLVLAKVYLNYIGTHLSVRLSVTANYQSEQTLAYIYLKLKLKNFFFLFFSNFQKI